MFVASARFHPGAYLRVQQQGLCPRIHLPVMPALCNLCLPAVQPPGRLPAFHGLKTLLGWVQVLLWVRYPVSCKSTLTRRLNTGRAYTGQVGLLGFHLAEFAGCSVL